MSRTGLTTALVLLALYGPGAIAHAEEPGRNTSVALASPVTHSDWMLRAPAPAWGPQGVRQILDRCKQCGWSRVYWRVFDGGRACYPSRLMEPLYGFDPDNYHVGRDSEALVKKLEQYDFGSFDALGEAVAYGQQIGIEVFAWLTINEDDHGWGLSSRFAREHPESRWVRRNGQPFRSQQSFAFEEVRRYKLGLLREVLTHQPDGILFDWIRTGDVRDNPQTDADGVAVYGYEQPNVDAFRKQFGTDPRELPNSDNRWARIRAEPQTLFMREARDLIRKSGAPARLPLAALVQQPWGYRGGPTDTAYKDNLHGLLLDVETWASEHLVDEFFAAGYYRPGGDAQAAWTWLRQATRGQASIGMFGWIGSAEQFTADVRVAEKLGASTLLLWESDYVGLPPGSEAVVRAMSECGHKRRVPATRKE